MTKTIREVQIGTRRILNTDWPVVDQVKREQLGKRVVWVVTRGICNGVPTGSESFDRLKDALQALNGTGQLEPR